MSNFIAQGVDALPLEDLKLAIPHFQKRIQEQEQAQVRRLAAKKRRQQDQKTTSQTTKKNGRDEKKAEQGGAPGKAGASGKS